MYCYHSGKCRSLGGNQTKILPTYLSVDIFFLVLRDHKILLKPELSAWTVICILKVPYMNRFNQTEPATCKFVVFGFLQGF